jgi:hypothetical protein
MKKNLHQGYALFTSIILTSLLVLVAYATTSISIRQLQLAVSGAESHIAFYAADTGLECALYWDFKASGTSAFSTSSATTITCNNTTMPVGGVSPSVFTFNTSPGCVNVTVTKNATSTTVESKGYNNCASGLRFERAIRITY